MNAELATARASLTVPSMRGPLPADRVGSLIQASVRTVIDDDGNPRNVRVEIDRDSFVTMLINDGSPFVDAVPALKDPHRALRAAVSRAKMGLAEVGADLETTAGMRLLWRRLGKDSSGTLKYALIVARPNAESGKWSGDMAATVSVAESGGTPSAVWDDENLRTTTTESAISAVVDRYRRERVLLHSDDLRVFINRVLEKTKAVGVGGMLHIIPNDNRYDSGDLDNAFRTAERALIAAGYQVLIQPITDGESVRGNVHAGMMASVARLTREIKNLSDEWHTDGGRNISIETFDKRLDAIHSISARADLFGDLIGVAAGEIKEALSGAKKLARDVQMGMLQL